jgi:hypothetical protein
MRSEMVDMRSTTAHAPESVNMSGGMGIPTSPRTGRQLPLGGSVWVWLSPTAVGGHFQKPPRHTHSAIG